MELHYFRPKGESDKMITAIKSRFFPIPPPLPNFLFCVSQALSGLCELMYDLRVIKEGEASDDSWEKVESSTQEEHPQTWPASQDIIINNFPSLASILMLLYGSYVGVVAPLHQTSSANSKSAFNFVPNRGATTLVPTK